MACLASVFIQGHKPIDFAWFHLIQDRSRVQCGIATYIYNINVIIYGFKSWDNGIKSIHLFAFVFHNWSIVPSQHLLKTCVLSSLYDYDSMTLWVSFPCSCSKETFTACCGDATIMSCDSAASLTTYVWIMATLYTTRNKNINKTRNSCEY